MIQNRRLLVYSYFCPDCKVKPGGVQQIVQPLLKNLEQEFNWSIEVIHTGECSNRDKTHHVFQDVNGCPDRDTVNIELLIKQSNEFQKLSDNFDLLLSIDRSLPVRTSVQKVLMSNTMAYQTEVNALLSEGWSLIISPSNHYKKRIKCLIKTAKVEVIPYGLEREIINKWASLRTQRRQSNPLLIQLPHRPDRRKGHIEAIEGLAKAPKNFSNLLLEFSWLNEERYSAFKIEIEQLAAKKEVKNQIKFTSWSSHEDRFKQRSRGYAILQVGQFEETFGLSIIESLLSNQLVLTTKQPAVKEIIGDSNLWIELSNPLNWPTVVIESLESGLLDNYNEDLVVRITEKLRLDRMAHMYDTALRKVLQNNFRS